MCATFRPALFDWDCSYPFVNLWMAVWLVIASCGQLESAQAPAASPVQQFDQYLQNQQLDQAQLWLRDQPESNKQKWKAPCALRLAHAFNQLGCVEKASALLESYWPLIAADRSSQAYGWMLRARLEREDDFKAWHEFCQAEKLMELVDWPSEDRASYAELERRLQTNFESQLQAAHRLSKSLMKKEAISILEQLKNQLAEDSVPLSRLGSLESAYLFRSLSLEIAELWLQLDEPQQGLDTLRTWLEPVGDALAARFLHQEIEKRLLVAKAQLLLLKPDLAMSQLEEAIAMGYQSGSARLTLEASLQGAGALAMLHQLPQAFDLLEQAQALIYQLPKQEQPEAYAGYLEQKCKLLCQMGRVHQAIEEIDSQSEKLSVGETKARLLLLKAKLYEQLGPEEKADEAYLELLRSGGGYLQSQLATRHLLKRVQTEKALASRLRDYLLQTPSPMIDEASILALAKWAIDAQLSSQEELYSALKPWLLSIQDPLLSAEAKYLLVQLLPPGPEASNIALRMLSEILRDSAPESQLHCLAQGLFITKQLQDPLISFQELLTLAKQAQEHAWPQAYDQLMTWAMITAANSSQRSLWQQAHEISTQQLKHLPSCDGWQWAYLELSFRLQSDRSNSLDPATCQLASAMEQQPTYWGLSACLSHSEAMMRLGLSDQALDLMSRFAKREDLPQTLKKRAYVAAADLAHRSGQSALAREWIASIFEKWPQLSERPWLELRKFTLEEYENKAPGSQETLHSLIAAYRQHPSALCAYYLRALQGRKESNPSEQLRLWEDVERKGQELSKLPGFSSDEHVLLASAGLERARCLKAMNLKPQAIGCLHSLLAPTGVSCSQSPGYYLLEQQARYDLAMLLLETSKSKEGLQQLELLLKDPYSSPWQARALLALAEFDLQNQSPQLCLEKLRQVSATTVALQARRLLLATRAWRLLQKPARASVHFAELMQLDPKDSEVKQAQSEALWDFYLSLKEKDPNQARALLLELREYKPLPLARRAEELLQPTFKKSSER